MATSDRRGVLYSLSSLREGVGLLSEGMGFLRQHRSLWALAAVPVFFAFVLMGLGLSVFWGQIDSLRAFVAASVPVLEVGHWWHWVFVGPGRLLFWAAGWLAVLLALALTLIASLLGANLLAAPFLDRLSERVEEEVRGASLADDLGDAKPSMIHQAFRSFGAELGRLLFLGSIGVGLTLAGFLLPGAHFLTGPLIALVTVSFLPLDYAGFALDRRGASFTERRTWLREHRPLMIGFGAIAFVACLVPGLNLLLMPALVTAGTLLVLKREPGVAPGSAPVSPIDEA